MDGILGKEKHININKCPGLSRTPGSGWVAKNVFVCLFRLIPHWGRKTHKQNPPKNSGQSREFFLYVFFLYVFFARSQVLPVSWLHFDDGNRALFLPCSIAMGTSVAKEAVRHVAFCAAKDWTLLTRRRLVRGNRSYSPQSQTQLTEGCEGSRPYLLRGPKRLHKLFGNNSFA